MKSLDLLRKHWLNRKCHHTMSSMLMYALYEALVIVEQESLETRWARHERTHRALVPLLGAMEGALAAQGLCAHA